MEMTHLKDLVKKYVPGPVLRAGAEVVYALKPDPAIERFVAHNRTQWAEQPKNPDGVIIFDAFPYAQGILANSYFLNVLARKLNASFRPFSEKGVNDPAYRRIYDSFGSGPEIVTLIRDPELLRKADEHAERLFASLKSKEDLFKLDINGYPLGIDVYETYLRFCEKPTVYLDEGLRGVLRDAVRLVYFWEDFFVRENVKAVVISHDCYTHLNTPCKIAYAKKIPVFNPYARGIYRMTKPFDTYAYFNHFPEIFRRMSPEEQAQALQLAKRQVERRISGEVGVDMPYSTKSGYSSPDHSSRILPDSDKIKVLIASHCFYDNPHGCGGLLFLDFYEWISFLGKLAEETDYEWFLKSHPDPLPGTEGVIQELVAKYPRIKVLPPETSHRQLVKEGLNFVLTGYGSIGFEYPSLGVQVINAGYNPRVRYGFNWQPKSVEEYRKLLLNLDELDLKMNLEELYECYYLNHYHRYADDLIFRSYQEAEKATGGYGQLSKPKAYDYFLNQLTPEWHREIIRKMSEFIDSGSKFLSAKGPEPMI